MVTTTTPEEAPWWDYNNDVGYHNSKSFLVDHCPCLSSSSLEEYSNHWNRLLEDNADDDADNVDGETWEIVYMCMVLLLMFAALISDRVGADMVMLGALTLCMASEIITIEEGLEGFANEGLLTVLVLFVVAEGISVTGALDWYMGKLLGRPRSIASAQLRLMVPIAVVSAFLNNTPVVAVMIPIVQRWGKNVGISPQQLLIPLSFASILGGTCTLIGTSTNLVVVGLLESRYPDDDEINIGLFSLGQYGAPVAMAGIAYVLLVSPYLLPGAPSSSGRDASGTNPLEDNEQVLIGARVTTWSPSAGRSVKRSGLRDTGGLYLVSVERSATGNLHRAVGPDFVLNVGDILYFTGFVEEFGPFCEEHGLELITSETQHNIDGGTSQPYTSDRYSFNSIATNDNAGNSGNGNDTRDSIAVSDGAADADALGTMIDLTAIEENNVRTSFMSASPGPISGARRISVPRVIHHSRLDPVSEDDSILGENLFAEENDIGYTQISLVQADAGERLQSINRMTDQIRGDEHRWSHRISKVASMVDSNGPPKIVVAEDKHLVVVGIDSKDRPGLLLDISKGLLRLNLSLKHTEAAVVNERSISIWRCDSIDFEVLDIEEIWTVLKALLESGGGVQAVKRRGLQVIRAEVTRKSNLIGKTAAEVDFRDNYRAAIVAVQKGGRNTTQALTTIRFDSRDLLILQASDNSPLLLEPPQDFYKNLAAEYDDGDDGISRNSSVASLAKLVSRFGSSASLASTDSKKKRNDKQATEKVNNKSREESKTNENEGENDVDADEDDRFYIEDDEAIADNEEGAKIEFDMEEMKKGESQASRRTSVIESVWRDLQVVNADKEAKGGNIEFLTAMQVAQKSQLANKTAAQAGIDKLPGVVLVSIERPVTDESEDTGEKSKGLVARISHISHFSRDDGSLGATSFDESSARTAANKFVTIAPEETLSGGDVLWFSGSASAVGDLRKIPGLQSFEEGEVQKLQEKIQDRRLVQAVISRKGPLVGKTVKEIRFRTRYGAAVISVHREGKRVHDHPGNIKLHAGDVLLLEAGPNFLERAADQDSSFALLNEVADSAPPRLKMLVPALSLAAVMLIVFTAGVSSLLICSLVAAMLMVLLGILTQQEARKAVNWEIYITIAAAFGIGSALTNSGVAEGVAKFLVQVGDAVNIGDAGLYAAVYFATFLISNVVTNNAAAALLFPIALQAAEDSGADRLLMSYCLMLGASASFMSPFGYTTNLLIYGPGGYKYNDFLIVGTPMQIVLWVISVAILSVGDQWYVFWIGTGIALVVVTVIRVNPGRLCPARNQTE